MSTATMTEKDQRVRDAVMQQLEWDPAVDAGAIGVAAHEGAVSLTGSTNTYAGKLAAERAAKRVRGVRSVANDLEVRLLGMRGDADIAADAAAMLRVHAEVPETVQVSVRHGVLTITGTVKWYYQSLKAEKLLAHLRGVRHVVNDLRIDPAPGGRDLKRHIGQALHRNATLDAHRINVDVSGGVARLTGTVTTWLQRQTAERAAYDAPGITMVDNQLLVEPPDGDTCEIC